MTQTPPTHRFAALFDRPERESEKVCDLMADIVNLASSDAYTRLMHFTFELEGMRNEDRYSISDVARSFHRLCTKENFDFITSFDRKITEYETQPQCRAQMLQDIRQFRAGIASMTHALHTDYGSLVLDDKDMLIMEIGENHDDYDASMLKRRKMATRFFFEHIDGMAEILEKHLAGIAHDRIGAGTLAADSPLAGEARDRSNALAGLYALLLGGFHEDLVRHYTKLTSPVEGKNFEAALGDILQEIVAYERSDHAPMSQIDQAVDTNYPAIERALTTLTADLAHKSEDTQQQLERESLLALAESMQATFEAYRQAQRNNDRNLRE